MDTLTPKEQPDRSKIKMNLKQEVRYWTKHLNISKEDLQKAVDKVGNSAAAVRKELAVDCGRGVCSRTLERGPTLLLLTNHI
ncbi:DUF3606 domain-containing protein [Bradyrhizobium icense]|uniref:DUF3606 domain-containing protein n=1 Tax=Bradyrhizobium icense TaxID=1274631 RepID=UPI0009F33117|nr:DUF3606 domain-containing protein [Bradyrhizobium icense]